MPYVKREIRSGNLLEVEQYFSSRMGRRDILRSANAEETQQDMERINQKRAEKKLSRLICANFSRVAGDLFVTLAMPKGVTEEEAMKSERNVLNRIKRLRKKKGLGELKYIAITERQGSWHHHLIINGGITLKEMAALWPWRTQMSVLDDTECFKDLANYLTKTHKPRKGEPGSDNQKEKRKKFKRRWHASRNLDKPVEKVTEIKRAPKAGEPKARKGYRLLNGWEFGCDKMGYLWSYAAYVAVEGKTKPGTRAPEAAERSGAAGEPARGGRRTKGRKDGGAVHG